MDKKFIIITGASSGFGAEVAKLFAKDGHNLLLIARRVDKIQRLNLDAMIEKADVTDFKQLKSVIDKGVSKFGPVDLLVNNAGVMKLGQMGVQPMEEYKTMIDVNVHGVINGIESVVNSMKKRKTGTIVNISSTAGIRTYHNHAVYSGTKFAVTGISETLRQEVASYGVRVTCICPGAFSTELLEHTSNSQIIEDYENWKSAMNKMADPIEVAKVIKYIFDAPQELTFRQISLHSTEQDE